MKLTWEQIHSAGTSGVGFNWMQLRLLGVGLPAAKGWLSGLIGVECPDDTWELVMKLKSVRNKAERKRVLEEYGLSVGKLAQEKIKTHLPMVLKKKTTPTAMNLEALAKQAAESLQESWSIGNASRFCDDPADWDSAPTEEIAAKLLPFLIRAGTVYNRCGVCGVCPCICAKEE